MRAPPARPRLLSALVGLLLLLAWPGGAGAAEVTLLRPPAQIRPAGAEDWRTLALGDAVQPGDRLRTGRGGMVEVRLGPQRAFRLGAVSEIAVVTLSEEAGGGLQGRLDLALGRLWSALVRPLRQRSVDYRVVTATATMGVKGTRFNVDQGAPGEGTALSVIDGEVAAGAPPKPPGPPREVSGPREVAPPQEVTFEEWALIVAAEQRLIIHPDGSRELRPLTEADRAEEWIAFNLQRDEALADEPEPDVPPPAAQPPAGATGTPGAPTAERGGEAASTGVPVEAPHPAAPAAGSPVPVEAPTPR